MTQEKQFLTRAEAAAHLSRRGLPTAKSTLEKMACRGGGPPYVLYGNRALYLVTELDPWAEGRLINKKNTSDRGSLASNA